MPYLVPNELISLIVLHFQTEKQKKIVNWLLTILFSALVPI